jgi:hypothetical protein
MSKLFLAVVGLVIATPVSNPGIQSVDTHSVVRLSQMSESRVVIRPVLEERFEKYRKSERQTEFLARFL